MSTEDALFKMANALVGLIVERGTIQRHMSDCDFDECLKACEQANPERYKKEIEIYL